MATPEEEVPTTAIVSIVLRLIAGVCALVSAFCFAASGSLWGIVWMLIGAYFLITVSFDLYKLSTEDSEEETN